MGKDAKCKFWTYNPRVKKCWLKTSDEGKTASTKGSVSGEKACGAPALKNSKEARDTGDSEEAEDVGELKGVMTSPMFGSSAWVYSLQYPPNVHETKTIVVPKGKRIRIQFSHFKVEHCCDYVTITEGDGTILGKYQDKPAKESIVSRTNTVHILFHSDASGQRDGWRLEWEAVGEATLSSDNCASPWTQLSTGCYLFQNRQENWFQADGTCQEQNSFLVEIDSAEETEVMLQFLSTIGGVSEEYDVWLGLTQIADHGNWTLMSSSTKGQAPSFSNWETPVTSEMPDCATMKASNGTWRAMKCSSSIHHLVICEKSTPVKMARNEGIKVGDLVRVRASVSSTIYGWGDVDHSSIGPVVSLEPNPKVNPSPKVIVDFPEQHGWRGRVSELEVVVEISEETTTTTTQRPEDGLAGVLYLPSQVMLGQSASLYCSFTRALGQMLDSIKWYKDDQEFLRVHHLLTEGVHTDLPTQQ